MATKNVKTGSYEPMDKLPSNTLKRHPKMELNKNDLLRLLSYLEGELQARDITIAALKAEKAKQLLYQAKYGRFGLGDPFHALQRDSECQKDTSFDEAAVKSMYDNQLAQLENLIATQRKAQLRMREQLAAVEKRYHKVLAELDEEKKKHALDTAQGDDVTYMLEKERERLKQEVDFEKGQVKKLEKELKKMTASFEAESVLSGKHKQVALMLIKERKRLVERLLVAEQRSASVEQTLAAEKSRLKGLVEGLAQDTQRSLQMEAAMEKHLSEFDIEREQLKAKLSREEHRNGELLSEVERLRYQLDAITQHYGIDHKQFEPPRKPEVKSTVRTVVTNIPVQVPGSTSKVSQPANKVFKNTPPNTPPEVRRGQMMNHDSPERDKVAAKPGPNSNVKRGIMQFDHSPPGKTERTVSEKPVDKVDVGATRVNVIGPTGVQVTPSAAGGPTVFTTPTGARISLNVGPNANATRKSSPAGRGVPPPVPPNKPAYVPPTSTPGKTSSPRPGAPSHTPGKPPPPSKFGITIHKDKITIAPDSAADGSRLIGSRPAPSAGDSGTVRKPSQDGPDCTDGPSDTHGDHSGPNLEHLQQLLVTMVEGPSEGSASVLEDGLPPSSNSSSSSSSHLNPAHSHLTVDTKDTCSPNVSPPPPPTVAPPSGKSEDTSIPIHQLAFRGETEKLNDLLTFNRGSLHDLTADGSTALHWAAQAGHDDCVRLLLEHGANPNASRHDHSTPLHLAAMAGNDRCLSPLLQFTADVNLLDKSGASALHVSASQGHMECCRVLLYHRAKIDIENAGQWTPLHAAVKAGQAECLELLLGHQASTANQNSAHNSPMAELMQRILRMSDVDGRTISHIAAARDSSECLSCLMRHCQLDLELCDHQGHTVLDVASPNCKLLLANMDKSNERTCSIVLEICQDVAVTGSTSSSRVPETTFIISSLKVTAELTWSALEHLVNGAFMSHLNDISIGLKTKKTSRYDQDSPDLVLPYSLGLSTDSIKHYVIGPHRWTPGMKNHSQASPFDVLCNNQCRQLRVLIKGWESNCLDSLAYETLISLSMLQNYHRLIEQYRSVVFYGPAGTGKGFLARRLAYCVQSKERQLGRVSEVHCVTFQPGFTRATLLQVLVERGCLLRAGTPTPTTVAPILLLENLHKVAVADVFGDLLKAIEYRGPKHPVRIDLGPGWSSDHYYLLENCYIIGTMERSRSTGLELSIQQRFRWVHLRNDIEPIKNMLPRQLYRKLLTRYSGQMPPADSATFRAVEWVICVWQRLNEGLGKLGLPELTLGPAIFLQCPIEVNKPKAIYKWLSMLWNHSVAPSVSQAVIRGSGTDIASPGGQQKVANTALYVLMQRAVVSGCPLSGQEKERYLSSFHGSNELDIKMRPEKRDGARATTNASPGPADGSTHMDSVAIDMPGDAVSHVDGLQGSFIAVVGTKSDDSLRRPQPVFASSQPTPGSHVRPTSGIGAHPGVYFNPPRPSSLNMPQTNSTMREKTPYILHPGHKDFSIDTQGQGHSQGHGHGHGQSHGSAPRHSNQAIAQKVQERLVKFGKHPSRAMSPDPMQNRTLNVDLSKRRAMTPDPYGTHKYKPTTVDGTTSRVIPQPVSRGGMSPHSHQSFSFQSQPSGNIIHVHTPPPFTEYIPSQLHNPTRTPNMRNTKSPSPLSRTDS